MHEQREIVSQNKKINDVKSSFILWGLLIHSYDELLALTRELSQQALEANDEILIEHMAEYPHQFLDLIEYGLEKLTQTFEKNIPFPQLKKSIDEFLMNLSRVIDHQPVIAELKNLNAKRYEIRLKQLHMNYAQFSDHYFNRIEKIKKIISKETKYDEANKKLLSSFIDSYKEINAIIMELIQNTFDNDKLIKPLESLLQFCTMNEKEIAEML